MASSLLFRIKSQFDSQGIKDAKQGFTGTISTVAKLTATVAALALTWRNLGVVLGVAAITGTVKSLVGLVKYTAQSVPAAGRAEVAFTRLRTQLELLGKGSTENLQLVANFAREASLKTRFSTEETQEAVTIALRRTGNLKSAIREVSVAQNVAYATGQDLISTTIRLNYAMAGNYRILRQITDLREEEIRAAAREGKILELLEKRFAGAAQKGAGTLATKMAVLNNITKETREEFGAILLPLAKFVTDIRIYFARVGLESTRTAKSLGAIATSAEGLGVTLATSLLKATGMLDKFNKSLSKGKEFTFDFNEELSKEAEKLGKTREEIQQIEREYVRSNEILRVAETQGPRALTKEQIELLRKRQIFEQRLGETIVARVRQQERTERSLFEKRQETEGKGKPGGNLAEFIMGASEAGLSIKEISKNLQEVNGLSKQAADALATVGTKLSPIFSSVEDSVERVRLKIDELKQAGVTKSLQAVGDEINRQIDVQLKPKWSVNVKLDFSSQDVQNAVKQAVTALLPGMIGGLLSAGSNAIARQRKAVSPAE